MGRIERKVAELIGFKDKIGLQRKKDPGAEIRKTKFYYS